MSQYPPPQPYPQQGPPMGPPPMGGPPMYGPPPKKKGIILLVLGLLTLVLGIILSVVGLGGMGKMAADAQSLMTGTGIFVAPGQTTMTLPAGDHFIMSFDEMEHNGKTYAPTDQFPNNGTVIAVTGADGAQISVTSPQGQGNFQSGSNSGEVVRQFTIPTDGQYTVSITNPDGMDERLIGVLSMDQILGIAGGAAAGVFGLACGVPLAIIGLILLVVWAIVRK